MTELTLEQEWDIFLIMSEWNVLRQRQEMFKIIGICLYLLGYS